MRSFHRRHTALTVIFFQSMLLMRRLMAAAWRLGHVGVVRVKLIPVVITRWKVVALLWLLRSLEQCIDVLSIITHLHKALVQHRLELRVGELLRSQAVLVEQVAGVQHIRAEAHRQLRMHILMLAHTAQLLIMADIARMDQTGMRRIKGV